MSKYEVTIFGGDSRSISRCPTYAIVDTDKRASIAFLPVAELPEGVKGREIKSAVEKITANGGVVCRDAVLQTLEA